LAYPFSNLWILDIFQLIFMGSASSLDICLGIIRYWLALVTAVKPESVKVVTQGFSHLAHPLFNLTRKDRGWRWGAEEQSAFNSLKEQITTALILALPDNSQPFQIEADSSDFATRAVLSQQSPEDNKWHPIAFLSKSLSLVEQYYEIHDKEMLAIVRALEEWRHFVEGAEHHYKIWTDHKNLQYFRMAKKLNQRQARWSLLLAQFDFIMHHRPTSGKHLLISVCFRKVAICQTMSSFPQS